MIFGCVKLVSSFRGKDLPVRGTAAAIQQKLGSLMKTFCCAVYSTQTPSTGSRQDLTNWLVWHTGLEI